MNFPSIVQPETVNFCNAKCIMCPTSKGTKPKGFMDFGLYKKIIDECARNKEYVKALYPFQNGEPLIHPEFSKYIEYAKKQNNQWEVALYTNASLLDKNKTLKILESGLDTLVVSFDGFRKETYESIRIGLNFDQVKKNVIDFINLKKSMNKNNPEVHLVIIAMDKTRGEVKDFEREWKNLADRVEVSHFSNWGGQVDELDSQDILKENYAPCLRLWEHLVILRDGTVSLCCNDFDGRFPLGDLTYQTIKEIWQGEIINDYRKAHLNSDFSSLPICKKCSYRLHQLSLLRKLIFRQVFKKIINKK